jgi:protein O-GlcNAc transferase
LCFQKIIVNLIKNKTFEVFIISNALIEIDFEGLSPESIIRTSPELFLARDRILELKLDILIYLDLGMDPMSYFLAFSRLAGIQMVLGGHPVTTGIPNVDYYLSASIMEPENAQDHYSEKLIKLNNPLCYFERPVINNFRKTRQQLGLPEHGRIYMCPMKLHKIHPDFDVAVADLLRKDKQGFVVFFDDHEYQWWKSELELRINKTIDSDLCNRIIFLPWMNKSDLLDAIEVSDVILDPFHFGIGSTAILVFSTGTPIVTWPGEFMRGRVGYAYCQMLDLNECVASSKESYADKAFELATDKYLRAKILEKTKKNDFSIYENEKSIYEFSNLLCSLPC